MADEWTAQDAASLLREPTGSDDKYSRGVLGVRTGSQRYPGAAVLGVEAAWRTGLGMVRYLGPEHPTSLVLARRPETVTAAGRVQAWLIGSGTDAAERTAAETAALREILAGDEPVVVDAGALDLAPAAHAPLVVTPHASEHAKLRAALGLSAPESSAETPEREAAAVETAAALGGVVLLKGAVTIVATPAGAVRTVAAPTAWLATAGTGDVLGGVLGALVAGAAARDQAGTDALDALGALAATGAWVHGHAGAAAVERAGGGAVTALDVAEAVPAVVGGLLRAHRSS
ncbi:NAD(P)H-hydrate dehydratase [Microbacterium sp. W1N]|uniref:ADP-dependent NAD(P)H-hydrate dehydratase n=1 Tax=Microbacterium festucae TaxID=2977531 RepID=UPI0021BF7513|nr:ADP/ATP-dependent (S)-NAD(P)H-hydrate dehydratase [Microbacterium festucae]MCT9818702.1 NAD(P)H-hydrate dehydratase [Microbacterium festucae]